MIAAVLQKTHHRHQKVLFAVAVFCCIAFFSGAASAAISWKRVGTVTTLTNNQMCYTDGTNVICDSSAPTISSGLVGIGSVGPITSLDMSQEHDALALPVGTTGNRPTGGALTAGEIRYNQTSPPTVEAYVNGSWVSLVGGASGGGGTTNYVARWTSSTALGIGSLYDTGTLVGIGTTSLSQTLTVNGNVDVMGSGNGYLTEIANAGTTGTTVNKLAKLTGVPATAVITAITDTDGAVGIVTGGAGTSGNAQIAVDGQASCVFDNTTVAGDFAAISTTTAGDCHDAGATRSTTSQTIGRVLASGSAGTYTVALGLNGLGGGVPAGTTGQVQFNSGSSTFAANANLTWDNTSYRLGIGTATPGYALDAYTGTVAGTTVHLDSDGVPVNVVSSSGGVIINTAATGQMAYYSGANAISGTPDLYVYGSNIGIGTSTPTYLLSLLGTSAQTIWMERGTTVGNNLTLQAGGGVLSGSNKNGGNLILASGISTGTGTSNIQLATYPAGSSGTGDNVAATVMTLTSGGNVGIGTTSPGYNLDISASPVSALHTTNGGDDGGYLFTVYTNNVNLTSSSYYDGTNWITKNTSASIINQPGTGTIRFYTDSGLTAGATYTPTQRMVINASGNVGIGTTTPGNLLETYDSAAKTAAYIGVLHDVLDTSSTASVNKVGMDIESTGIWNGTSAVNTGLIVNATGGTKNYAATFSGGNVGIGDAAPDSTLSVISNITTTRAAAIYGNSLTTGTGLYVLSPTLTSGKLVDLEVSGTAAAASQTALNILTAGANGTNAITTYAAQISNTHTNATSGTNVGLYLNASGATTANYGLIVNAGNVGIGTTAPESALNVSGTVTVGTGGTNTDVAIYKNAGRQITFDSGPTTGTGMTVNIGTSANTNSTLVVNGGLAVGGYTQAQAPATGAIIAGSVGIGTTAPAYTLEVNGSVLADSWLRTSGATGWYSETYGGGWYMSDTTWIRSYNSKQVYMAAGFDTNAGSGVNCAGGMGGGYALRVCGTEDVTSTLTAAGTIYANGIDGWSGNFAYYGLNCCYSVNSGTWAATNDYTIIAGGGGGGRILAGDYDAYSDIRKKTDIATITADDGLDFVRKVNPVSFHWKKDVEKGGKAPLNNGYIAQQLLAVGYSNLVNAAKDDKDKNLVQHTDTFDGVPITSVAGVSLTANYLGAIPLLHAALRSLLDKVEALAARVAGLAADDIKIIARLAAHDDQLAALKAANDNLHAANNNEAAQIKALTARLDAVEHRQR
jgi:hypothetical protein